MALTPATSLAAQPAFPNPLDGLLNSPQALGQLLQRVGTYLLDQAVHGLHDFLITLTQGDDNVITHTPAGLTYRHPLVQELHDTLTTALNWGLVAALAVTGVLVILGPNSPLSYPAAGEIVPRVAIAFLIAHSSLQWGGWFIELSNALCTAVAPADPFPLTSSSDLDQAFGLLGLALVYGFMALFLSLSLSLSLPSGLTRCSRHLRVPHGRNAMRRWSSGAMPERVPTAESARMGMGCFVSVGASTASFWSLTGARCAPRHCEPSSLPTTAIA
jgi:hypothetical protein